MSDQDGAQASVMQRPTNNDKEVWRAYWRQQGKPWRTEPEIDADRQKYLAERRDIKPDIEQGIYPFRDIKLCRADVEWLLATHENGKGPVDWRDVSQRKRKGLDLRGADLRQVDLRRLPLVRMHGGLTREERVEVTPEQSDIATVLLEGANLAEAHLEGACLSGAHLEEAKLRKAYMKRADLSAACLKGAYLDRADLKEAHLFRAHLEEAHLNAANLAGADLRSAFFDNASTLRDVIVGDAEHRFISVADVRWAGVNLALVNWPQKKREKVLILGDEFRARQPKTRERKSKDEVTRLADYEAAVRANRQISVELQNQGLHELAAYFSYRAQRLQRVIFRRQRKFGQYLFFGFLDLLAGYGYRPSRSVLWYLVIIFGFAITYFAFGHISPLEAFVLSLTSFHGRGFFPGTNLSLSDPRVVLAAFEAVVGLFIEISFIATFTKRFFGS